LNQRIVQNARVIPTGTWRLSPCCWTLFSWEWRNCI